MISRNLAVLLLSLIVSLTGFSQQKNGVRLGLNVNQFQRDFGLGIHVNSPYFIKQKMAIRLGANLQWLQHVDRNGEETWTPYGNVQLGIRTRHFIVENKIFIYGEGGVCLLLPNQKFSSTSALVGGYGLFGFEFLMTERMSFILELGGMGTGSRADLVPHKPIHSNGFVTSAGFRFNL